MVCEIAHTENVKLHPKLKQRLKREHAGGATRLRRLGGAVAVSTPCNTSCRLFERAVLKQEAPPSGQPHRLRTRGDVEMSYYLQVKSSGQWLNIEGSSNQVGAVACQGDDPTTDNFLWTINLAVAE